MVRQGGSPWQKQIHKSCVKHNHQVVVVSHPLLKNSSQIGSSSPSWWFQSIWKILVKLDHFPGQGGNKKYLKPPPSLHTIGIRSHSIFDGWYARILLEELLKMEFWDIFPLRNQVLLMEEIPNTHLGCFWNPVNNGRDLPYQLVCRICEPSTVWLKNSKHNSNHL